MKHSVIFYLCTIAVFVAAPAFADSDGLMTYDRFLQLRSLDPTDLECINPVTEAVLHPRTQVPELNKQVCEVWVKEKTIPGQRLTYNDGTPVYKTSRMIRVPTTTESSEEFMVKQDSRTREEPVKRYVIESGR